MNIVVLVKQVPDSGSERKLDSADNTVDRAAADNVINEIDEYAIEEALTVKEAHGGEVTVLTVGPDAATDADPQGAVDGRGQGRARVRRRPSTARTRVQTVAGPRRGARHARVRPGRCAAPRPPTRSCASCRRCWPSGSASPQLSGARKLTVDGVDGDDRAADRRRLLGRGGAAAGDRVDLGHDQRAALPLVQGDHGREEEAGARRSRWPTSASTPAAVGLANATSAGARASPAARRKGEGVKVTDEGDGGAKIVDFLAAQKIV